MNIDLHYSIRPKTRKDSFVERLSQLGVYLLFMSALLLYSPILIYNWVRHRMQPSSFNTIVTINDSVESVYGFTGSWYNSASIDTPVSLLEQYVDVSTIDRLKPEKENRFLINFNVIKIRAVPENNALKNMLFTGQSYKYNGGVLLQRIYPDNEQWALVFYDLTTNEEKVLEYFNDYFKLDHIPKNKNGELIFQGDNGKQKLKIRITTTASTVQIR